MKYAYKDGTTRVGARVLGSANLGAKFLGMRLSKVRSSHQFPVLRRRNLRGSSSPCAPETNLTRAQGTEHQVHARVDLAFSHRVHHVGPNRCAADPEFGGDRILIEPVSHELNDL